MTVVPQSRDQRELPRKETLLPTPRVRFDPARFHERHLTYEHNQHPREALLLITQTQDQTMRSRVRPHGHNPFVFHGLSRSGITRRPTFGRKRDQGHSNLFRCVNRSRCGCRDSNQDTHSSCCSLAHHLKTRSATDK